MVPQLWLDERPAWPRADRTLALPLNRCGDRLSVRGASGIIRSLAADSGLDDQAITHTPGGTFTVSELGQVGGTRRFPSRWGEQRSTRTEIQTPRQEGGTLHGSTSGASGR